MDFSDVAILIPARMESTRFPGKPLAHICGKPMIQHVYERAIASKVKSVYIATDSVDIEKFCLSCHIPVLMTGNHATGSDRVCEASLSLPHQYIINLQGDEPIVPPQILDDVASYLTSNNYDSRTIVTATSHASHEDLDDYNVVKVVCTKNGTAAFFTRSPVYTSCTVSGDRLAYKQIGVYGYHVDTLRSFSQLGFSSLEILEKIEIMRWIDHGFVVHNLLSPKSCLSVDTIGDLTKVESLISHT